MTCLATDDGNKIEKAEQKKVTRCCICTRDIYTDFQIYYVFIGGSRTSGNMEYCVDCYIADVREKRKADPFKNPLIFHIYSKNFIRMNK